MLDGHSEFSSKTSPPSKRRSVFAGSQVVLRFLQNRKENK